VEGFEEELVCTEIREEDDILEKKNEARDTMQGRKRGEREKTPKKQNIRNIIYLVITTNMLCYGYIYNMKAKLCKRPSMSIMQTLNN